MKSFEEVFISASKNTDDRRMFYKMLLDLEVYLLTNEDDTIKEDGTLIAGSKVNFLTIQKQDGSTIIPFFSNLELLQKFITSNQKYISMNAKSLFELVRDTPMILNPNFTVQKEFTVSEINALRDGTIFQPQNSRIIEKETKIMIGEPKEYPHDVVNNLIKIFKKEKRVLEAYLVHYYNPEEEVPPHSLILVKCTSSYDEVIAKAGITVEGLGKVVDFVRYDNSSLTNLIISKYKPFYKKKLFVFW
ncbi:enhanced serine sensitivity protein SseB C-terminal domain-containing protein [Abyssisolibacter fermentans]|uniref:enhanced serine sensitivity protein SseB C-terminal domain-containing protein n=1 Tax=Abyssisolibacter fermentans TaxID=1766203 RepID=UPI000833F6F0|nr:enhanced serine sensitivity protein SseB C-terminal domain-containing protein [Abyssisolibacter fermentans]